jgi:hypothetical protein
MADPANLADHGDEEVTRASQRRLELVTDLSGSLWRFSSQWHFIRDGDVLPP